MPVELSNPVACLLKLTCACSEDLLTAVEARRVLAESAARGLPEVMCRNWEQGCPVTSYSRLLELHEKFCPYQKKKNENMVKGTLSLMRADPRHFTPFCDSFKQTKEKSKSIRFLFKQTQESVKICAQSQEEVPFTITFYDKQKLHMSKSKIKGTTGSSMYLVDAKVFKENGPEVDFKIEIHKP